MTIEGNRQGTTVIVKVVGRMGAENHTQFEKACEQWIKEGATHLVLDVAGLDYISSAGLGAFVRVAQTLQKKNGNVLLCGIKGLVKEVFEITHLISLFGVFESTQDACQSIK